MKAHSLLRSPLLRSSLALLALPLAPSLVAADPLPKLTVERINSEPSLSGTLPSRLQWHPDGKRLTFLRRSGEASSLHAIDASTGETTLLLDGARAVDPRRQAAAAAPHLGHVAPRRPHPARARGGRRVHRGRRHRRRARPREDAGDRGVPRGLPRRHEGRIRPQERPVGRGPGHRQGDPPHPGRLRHPPQRKARLGLRGGAGLPRRPGVPLVAGLPGDRLPAARPVPRADLPHRGLRARAQRGRVAALPQGGRPELDRPPGRRRLSRRTARPAPSASCPSPRTTSTSCPSSAGRRIPARWRSSTSTGPRTSWSCASCPFRPRPASRSGRPAPCSPSARRRGSTPSAPPAS